MSKPTRREFLRNTVLGAVGTGMGLAAFSPEDLLAGTQEAKGARSYAAGKYALLLGGTMAGWIQSVEGGHATSDVVNEKTGRAATPQKHIGNVKYEDISLACGTGMSRAFYEWMKATFDRRFTRQNGAIVSCDYNYNEVSRLDFNQALITEIGFPALDAASKDAARMSIKFSPEYTRMTAKAGGKVAGAYDTKVQKKWMPANFRLQIAGLDCTRVNKIEALTVKQKVVENPVGELRTYQKEPAHLEIPNLVITLPESHAAPFSGWHKSFEIAGKNDAQNKKSGQLDYLTEDLRQPLFTLQFVNLGIFKLTPEKVEAHGDNIRRVKAEMYCERIQFSYSSAAWA